VSQPEPPFRRLARTPTLWIVAATVLFFGLLSILNRPETGKTIKLSQFMTLLDDGQVRSAEILEGDQVIQGRLSDGTD
jgi:ATP-dependent Zn protease